MLWLTLVGCLVLPEDLPPDDTDETDAVVDTDPPPIDTDDLVEPPVVCPRANLQATLDDLASWPTVNACGHLWLSAHTRQRNLGVKLYLETRERTFSAGQAFTLDLAAPRDVVGSLLLEEGTSLQPVCVLDDDTGGDPTPSATWRGVRGTMTFTVDTPGEGGAFVGHVSLADVVIELVGRNDSRCTLPDTTWSNVDLGWYPAAE